MTWGSEVFRIYHDEANSECRTIKGNVWGDILGIAPHLDSNLETVYKTLNYDPYQKEEAILIGDGVIGDGEFFMDFPTDQE